jgi:phosphoglycolate phosphatase
VGTVEKDETCGDGMTLIHVGKHTIPDVNLVIFDKDGTLIDLYQYWSQMADLRASMVIVQFGLTQEQKQQIMLAMGVDTKNGYVLPQGPIGIKKREVVRDAVVSELALMGYEGTTRAVDFIFDEVDRVSAISLYSYIHPTHGALKLLRTLSESGCKVAVATTDRTQRAELAMKYMHVYKYIDAIVGSDMVKNPKPHPETIQHILETLKVHPANAVMVGDALTDVEMGRNAKLRASIGVTTGSASGCVLRFKTNHVVSDLSKIWVEK